MPKGILLAQCVRLFGSISTRRRTCKGGRLLFKASVALLPLACRQYMPFDCVYFANTDNADSDMANSQHDDNAFSPRIPTVQQNRTTIVTAVSAIVESLTFAAILLDGLTAGSATPAVVALVVGVQSALGATSSIETALRLSHRIVCIWRSRATTRKVLTTTYN